MPVWVCAKCKQEVDNRCRPAACPKCGGPKDGFAKKDEAAAPAKPPRTCC
jgi:hypothetical protein